jgi:hypothetical protein
LPLFLPYAKISRAAGLLTGAYEVCFICRSGGERGRSRTKSELGYTPSLPGMQLINEQSFGFLLFRLSWLYACGTFVLTTRETTRANSRSTIFESDLECTRLVKPDMQHCC